MPYDNLLSPLKVGPRTLRNRVLVTAHVPGLAVGGAPGPAYAAYHRARARGGAGMQITGATPVHVTSGRGERAISNLDDRVIDGYRTVASAVHEEGGVIIAQLAHYGATLSDSAPGAPLWGVSGQAADLVTQQPHAMTIAEIAEVTDAFAAAASRVREGRMDGVEILSAFGLLLATFMSPAYNSRTDAYGGSVANRLRFPLEVAEAVRGAVGPDLIVGMRIPGDEFVEGGLNIAQMREIAPLLTESGNLDYLNVIAGTNMDRRQRALHWPPTPAPHGLFVDLAAQIREVVSIPVFTTGRVVDPAMADQIVADGKADMVGMTRAHIADPEIVRKISTDRAREIRPCIGANFCISRALKGGPIRCLHNPETAREHEWGAARATAKPRSIAVIGGGPAGLEAARVAAERGHRVQLFEASDQLGGQFRLRAAIPTWAEFQGAIDWRLNQLRQMQVQITMNRRIEAGDIAAMQADAIIIATGAIAATPTIRTDGSVPMITPHDLIRDGAMGAKRVVIWDHGGGSIGAGAMDAANDMGLKLDVVTPQMAVAEDLDLVRRTPLYERLMSAGAVFHPNTEITGIASGGASLRNVITGAHISPVPTDLVVANAGRVAQTALVEAVKSAGVEMHLTGDALAPRTAEEAFVEGAMAGRAV